MRRERYELESVIGRMVDLMGAEEVLMELARAMSTDELEDSLEFIDRMNDWGLLDEDEEDYLDFISGMNDEEEDDYDV